MKYEVQDAVNKINYISSLHSVHDMAVLLTQQSFVKC